MPSAPPGFDLRDRQGNAAIIAHQGISQTEHPFFPQSLHQVERLAEFGIVIRLEFAGPDLKLLVAKKS
jgi:hypothetical protein